MNKEESKLIDMLEQNKISQSDYEMLSAALNKKTIFPNIEESMLINPFRKIAGFKALIIGIGIFILMSLLGTYANLYLDGAFGALLAVNIKTQMHPNFLLLMYQSIVDCTVLATLFYIAAILCGKRRIRMVDFYGTVALSRFPYLVLTGLFALIYLVYPQYYNIDVSKGYDLTPTVMGIIISLIWMACYAWQALTYFFAFRESSGLENKKLWISYIICVFILGDMIAMMLARLPLYL